MNKIKLAPPNEPTQIITKLQLKRDLEAEIKSSKRVRHQPKWDKNLTSEPELTFELSKKLLERTKSETEAAKENSEKSWKGFEPKKPKTEGVKGPGGTLFRTLDHRFASQGRRGDRASRCASLWRKKRDAAVSATTLKPTLKICSSRTHLFLLVTIMQQSQNFLERGGGGRMIGERFAGRAKLWAQDLKSVILRVVFEKLFVDGSPLLLDHFSVRVLVVRSEVVVVEQNRIAENTGQEKFIESLVLSLAIYRRPIIRFIA